MPTNEITLPEKEYSVPLKEAVGYMHIGVDTAYDPAPGEGYWIPVGEERLAECEHPPRGHIRQFPKDDCEPEMVGDGEVPDWVDNWDYRKEENTDA